MEQRFESRPTSQCFRSLLSRTVSRKGLLVQAITCQFALPAIANASLPVIDSALTQADLDAYGDIDTPTAIEPTTSIAAAEFIAEPSAAGSNISPPLEGSTHTLVSISQLKPATEELAITLVPPAALAETETIPTFSTAPSPWKDESSADFYETHQAYLYSAAHSTPNEPEEPPEAEVAGEEPEFSWFSIDPLTEKDNAKKLTFVTQLEATAVDEQEALPILIAGPQDLNPGLSKPPDPISSQDASQDAGRSSDFNNPLFNNSSADPPFSPNSDLSQPAEPLPIETAPTESFSDDEPVNEAAFIQWQDLEVDIRSEFDNFGQSSWAVLPTLNGQLTNGSQISISSGYAQFEQADFESVGYVPLALSWQGNTNDVELAVSGGIDFFSRLPASTHASAIATAPIGEEASVSIAIEQGSYLSNAQTLENEISRWQYGPDFFWQISPKLSVFSMVRFANYSDGNSEQQSFSRLERTIGEEASVALNFSNQSFRQNREDTSGYFSPRDSLIATVEMSWQEQIADELSCGLLASVGQQRLAGEWALAYSGRAICTVDIASALQIDLGYQFSNVSSDQSGLVDNNAYTNQQIIGGIRVRF